MYALWSVRQTGGSSSGYRPNPADEECESILAKMYEVMSTMNDNFIAMRTDPKFLWPYQNWPKGLNPACPTSGSYTGHQEKQDNMKKALKNLLKDFRDAGCEEKGYSLPPAFWKWKTSATPLRPVNPYPLVPYPPNNSFPTGGNWVTSGPTTVTGRGTVHRVTVSIPL